MIVLRFSDAASRLNAPVTILNWINGSTMHRRSNAVSTWANHRGTSHVLNGGNFTVIGVLFYVGCDGDTDGSSFYGIPKYL